MFMNKINMPQTCTYNFSYKQAIKLLQKPVTQEVTQVELCATPTLLSTQSSDNRQLFDGGTSTHFLRQFAAKVEETRNYLQLKQNQSNLLQGHTKRFCSHVGEEQSCSA